MTTPDRTPFCPECESGPPGVDRRGFFRTVGVLAAAGVAAPHLRAADPAPAAIKAVKPAEDMVRELFSGLSAEQKKAVVFLWDHGIKAGKGLPTRLGMYNAPIQKSTVIADAYKPAQRDLLDKIFRSIANGDEGYQRLSRGGEFDNSGSFDKIGASIFGDPTDGQKFSLVFAGHHLTIRCDGNSEPGAAFGGPMYYGHSPDGYSDHNIFFYQTKAVRSVYDALDGKQRTAALINGSPGEQAPSVAFRKTGDKHPGVALKDLSNDQRALVMKVMRDLVSPFRKEDGDEVMEIVKANGGEDVIHLAFYQDKMMQEKPDPSQPWHFWRLEGPGFVWNFRVLPHVHTFVNIAKV